MHDPKHNGALGLTSRQKWPLSPLRSNPNLLYIRAECVSNCAGLFVIAELGRQKTLTVLFELHEILKPTNSNYAGSTVFSPALIREHVFMRESCSESERWCHHAWSAALMHNGKFLKTRTNVASWSCACVRVLDRHQKSSFGLFRRFECFNQRWNLPWKSHCCSNLWHANQRMRANLWMSNATQRILITFEIEKDAFFVVLNICFLIFTPSPRKCHGNIFFHCQLFWQRSKGLLTDFFSPEAGNWENVFVISTR